MVEFPPPLPPYYKMGLIGLGLQTLLLLVAAAMLHRRLRPTRAAYYVWLLFPVLSFAAGVVLHASRMDRVHVASVLLGLTAFVCVAGLVWKLRSAGLTWRFFPNFVGLLLTVPFIYLAFGAIPTYGLQTDREERFTSVKRQGEIGLWIRRSVERTARLPDAVDEDGQPWRARAADEIVKWEPQFEGDSVFSCPAFTIAQPDLAKGRTAFALPVGEQTAFPGGIGMRAEDVIDGENTTLILFEACGRLLPMLGPGDVDTDTLPPGVNLPGKEYGMSDGWLSSYHRGLAYAANGAGVVRGFTEDTDPEILRLLTTPNGGEPVPDDF